jgi:hypothetical protein
MTYDALILAVGAVTNYVDLEGVREYAFPLKDIPDALNLRNRLIAFMNWVDNYLTYDRKARMIVDTIPLNREAGPSVRRHHRRLQVMETTGTRTSSSTVRSERCVRPGRPRPGRSVRPISRRSLPRANGTEPLSKQERTAIVNNASAFCLVPAPPRRNWPAEDTVVVPPFAHSSPR